VAGALLEELGQRADADAGRALAQVPRSRGASAGPAMSRCAQGASHELAEKMAALIAPAPAVAVVLHVRHLRVEVLLLEIDQRQPPEPFAGARRRREQLVRQRVAAGEEAAHPVAERHHAGTGEVARSMSAAGFCSAA
jgi:hypothetical protein